MTARQTDLTENLEDYLEAVLVLCRQHGHAHVNDIARHKGVKKPSANSALRSLADKGLVVYEKYQPVTLTARGRDIAASILGRHQVLTEFFRASVGLKPKEAEDVACKLEHVLEDAALLRLLTVFERIKAQDSCPVCGAKASPPKQSASPKKTRPPSRRKTAKPPR